MLSRVYTAIEQLSEQGSGVALRPSNIGNCPLRLKWSLQDQMKEERDPRRQWMTLQGTIAEEAIARILEIAGAEIMHPPSGQDVWHPDVEPDADTGFKPHFDRLIRWPEVGLTEWNLLELKDLRVTAQINLWLEGLYAEDTYWHQAVTYLMQSTKAIENYARVEDNQSDSGSPTPWGDLHRSGVVPVGLVFFSAAKDPSTTKMMLGQRIKPAQYENNPAKMKPEQLERKQWKEQVRARLEEYGGTIDFNIEVIDRDDPAVIDTYEDIKIRVREIQGAVKFDGYIAPSHDISVPEDEMDDECKWYCPYLQRHMMLGFQVVEAAEGVTP